MEVRNTTHYFNEYTKQYNVVPDPTTYFSKESRRIGYFQRLYWDFIDCQNQGGQSFYVTFTYNDRAIPKYYGYPVFNYEHIRLITNGVLKQRLYRDYGSRLKYFCSCESGEGQGQRGEGNNPHYHFIFNVFPDPDNRSLYVPIDPREFLEICKEVWVGHRGWFPWKYAKFGSVKPGRFGIQVKDPRALRYVAKYVIKSQKEHDIECDLIDKWRLEYIDNCITFSNLRNYFYVLKSRHSSGFNHQIFLSSIGYDKFYYIKRKLNKFADYRFYLNDITDDSVISNILEFKRYFMISVLPDLISARLNEFRRKYSGKVRCSHSLGRYGLTQIYDQSEDPKFKIIEKKTPKVYTPCLYYQRKLYYDVVRCPFTGNPLYVLNKLGKQYKVNSLNLVISRTYRSTLEHMSQMFENDIHFFYKYDRFNNIVYGRSLQLSQDYLSIVYKYAVWKSVYHHRAFNKLSPIALSDDFKIEHIKVDYSLFIQYDFYSLDFDSGSVKNVFARDSGNMPMDYLPPFKPYLEIFEFLDRMNDVISSDYSEFRKKDSEDKESLKRKHAALGVNIA